MDPSSQKSTYVLVNPVSKVILFLAFQKKAKLFHKSEVSDNDSTTESKFENDYDDGDAESDAEAQNLRSESVECFDQKYHHHIVLLI